LRCRQHLQRTVDRMTEKKTGGFPGIFTPEDLNSAVVALRHSANYRGFLVGAGVKADDPRAPPFDLFQTTKFLHRRSFFNSLVRDLLGNILQG